MKIRKLDSMLQLVFYPVWVIGPTPHASSTFCLAEDGGISSMGHPVLAEVCHCLMHLVLT